MHKEIKKCQFCKFCNKQTMLCESSLSPNRNQTMYLDETCEVWCGESKVSKKKLKAKNFKPIPKYLWEKIEKELGKK